MIGHMTRCFCVFMESFYPQGAITQILEKTKEDFFLKIVNILREAADVFCGKIKEIPCITCPSKPEGAMFAMVR